MSYDSWKLDNQWDEEARRIRTMRIRCEDCDEARADIWAEDMTGYDPKGGAYLCDDCYDKRCDYPEPDREWPQAENE